MPETSVLIAEDDHQLAAVIQECVEAEGFQTMLAKNGEEALEAYQSQSPDIILADIHMPGINGLELLRRIREQGDHVPFIVCSSYGHKQNTLEALRMGAFDFLEKPLDFRYLSRMLHEAEQFSRAYQLYHSQLDEIADDPELSEAQKALKSKIQRQLFGMKSLRALRSQPNKTNQEDDVA